MVNKDTMADLSTCPPSPSSPTSRTCVAVKADVCREPAQLLTQPAPCISETTSLTP